MSRIRLYCLPYAGGSASLYRKWNSTISSDIELIPLEPSGHGKRIREPLYKNFKEAVSDLKNRIDTQSPYMIFGHSLGALLAINICRELENSQASPPSTLFISGAAPPHIYNSKEKIAGMSDSDFLNKVEAIGGTPPGFTDEPELLTLLLPVLKNDFRIVEEHSFPYPPEPVSTALQIIKGDKDSFADGDIFDWNEYTEGEVSVHTLPGNHFFINSCIREVTELINSVVC